MSRDANAPFPVAPSWVSATVPARLTPGTVRASSAFSGSVTTLPSKLITYHFFSYLLRSQIATAFIASRITIRTRIPAAASDLYSSCGSEIQLKI